MNLYITIIFSIFEFMIDSITNLIDQYIEYMFKEVLIKM